MQDLKEMFLKMPVSELNFSHSNITYKSSGNAVKSMLNHCIYVQQENNLKGQKMFLNLIRVILDERENEFEVYQFAAKKGTGKDRAPMSKAIAFINKLEAQHVKS